MNRKKILIADDSELNRAILVNVLENDFDILEVSNGREAIAALQNYSDEIAALLLDIVMPEVDGFEVLTVMGERGWIDTIPTIMISAETSGTYIDRAFKLGASDYVSRPFVPNVIRRRIINAILLHTKKQQLIGIVADRFYQRAKTNDMMVSILSHVVELRCGDGGPHMSSVANLTGFLLHHLSEKTDRYHLTQEDIEAISTASSLHDVGKLLIPEEILKKKGPLTPGEFEIIKRHTLFGANMITSLPIYKSESLVKYAAEICRWHHERWNGEGYPDGLRGDEIPIAAQAVSIADVYDALTSERSYKKAFSHEKALQMIFDGECGSFSPLLLECLRDLEDTFRSGRITENVLDQSRRTAHEVVQELYRTQDISSARVALQLEEERAKHRFFSELTQEFWFEYTAQPSALSFSEGASKLTGMPSVVVDPFNNIQLRSVVSVETLNEFRAKIASLTPDETYLETEAQVTLNGETHWCQVAVLITWSPNEAGGCTSLLGKVIDIDKRRRRLEAYGAAPEESSDSPALLPVGVGPDGVLHITGTQVSEVLRGYRQAFQIARLVDPAICMQVSSGVQNSVDKSDHCYAVWNRMKRCDRCISQEVVRTFKPQTKIEVVGSEIFYVLAICVKVDDMPYSLELVNPIHADDMLGDSSDESILNQLLVRNRQVYMDSVTKVYNRRYYDERLRKQNGNFAFAMIDLDHFKEINDQFGHLAGDAALSAAAQAIKSEIRGNDALVRYGGDEFFLLFRDMPENMLEKKLQNIRHAVESIEFPEHPGMHLTASIGGAAASGLLSDSIYKADLAMYRSKEKRNCVSIYRKEDENHDAT